MASDPTPIEPTSNETPEEKQLGTVPEETSELIPEEVTPEIEPEVAAAEASPALSVPEIATEPSVLSAEESSAEAAEAAIASLAASESSAGRQPAVSAEDETAAIAAAAASAATAAATPATTSSEPADSSAAVAAAAAAGASSALSASDEERQIEAVLAEEVAAAQELREDVAEYTAERDEPIQRGLFVRLSESMQRNPVRSGVIIGTIVLLILGFFIPVPEPHVALGGEAINSNVPWWFTNSVLTTIIVDILLLILAFGVYFSQKMVPSGLQNVMEAIIEYFWSLAQQISGKAARTYFPWIMTIFLFVILSNWTGLIPGVGSIGWVQIHEDDHASVNQEQMAERMAGQLAMADGKLVLLTPDKVAAGQFQEPVPTEAGVTEEHGDDEHAATEEHPAEEHVAAEHFIPLFRAPSADLNVTFALAITVMTLVQIYGFRALGFSYLQKFFTLRGVGMMKGINAFVGILELISELSRILSFGFRLFGNIFAGEIVLATMAFLAAFVLPAPFYILEVFVGFVQALVFAMLALVFFTLSTHAHGGEDHAHDEAHADSHVEALAGEPAAVAAH